MTLDAAQELLVQVVSDLKPRSRYSEGVLIYLFLTREAQRMGACCDRPGTSRTPPSGSRGCPSPSRPSASRTPGRWPIVPLEHKYVSRYF